jgi:hypothetical protein
MSSSGRHTRRPAATCQPANPLGTYRRGRERHLEAEAVKGRNRGAAPCFLDGRSLRVRTPVISLTTSRLGCPLRGPPRSEVCTGVCTRRAFMPCVSRLPRITMRSRRDAEGVDGRYWARTSTAHL